MANITESYYNKKINKLIDIVLSNKETKSYFNLDYISPSGIRLNPDQLNNRQKIIPNLSGQEKLFIKPTPDNAIRIPLGGKIYDITETWNIDLSYSGINNEYCVAGVIDNLALETGFYFLWAFAGEKAIGSELKEPEEITIKEESFLGFGLTKQPCALTGECGTATPGSYVKFYNVDENYYKFTVGAMVLIFRDKSYFNTGIITSITKNTMYVLLDNLAYSSTINSSSEIIQLNNFKPYIVGDTEQVLFAQHYKLLTGGLYYSIENGFSPFIFKKGKYNIPPQTVHNIDFDKYGTEVYFLKDCIPPTAVSYLARLDLTSMHDEIEGGITNVLFDSYYLYSRIGYIYPHEEEIYSFENIAGEVINYNMMLKTMYNTIYGDSGRNNTTLNIYGFEERLD